MARMERDVRCGELGFTVIIQTTNTTTHCMVSDHPGMFERMVDEVQRCASKELNAAAEKLKGAQPSGMGGAE